MPNSQDIKNKNTGRNPTIALLGTSLYFDFPISIFQEARELSQQKKFNLLYFAGLAYKSPHSSAQQANILYNLVTPRTSDGVLIISNLLCSYTSSSEFSEFCHQFHPLPVVSMGMAIEGIPGVVPDNTAGMYDAVCHLIEVHNYSLIAFLSGPPQHPDAKERFAGFSRAMESHGLPVDESLLLEGTFEMDSAKSGVKELLDNREKIPGKDVQAIVCCNDYMAIGVIIELQSRGIRVPDQIAVTGFDDIIPSHCLFPPVSTVQYPLKTLTTKATEILLKLMQGKNVPDVVTLKTRFHPRHSCGCPNTLDQTETQALTERMEQQHRGNSPGATEYMNKQLIKIGGPMVLAWKEALPRLHLEGALELCSHPGNPSGKPDQTAWELLSRVALASFSSINHQAIIHDLESALTSTLELSKLLNLLTRLLPEAGIKRYTFCLYENPGDSLNKPAVGTGQHIRPFPAVLPPWSRLVSACNRGTSLKLPRGGIRFSTYKLLPEEIIRKQGWQSWIILSLFFKQEHFGYILLDSDSLHENFYWSICNQISGTLMGIHLLNETRKAHDQKTQFFINVAHETKTPLTLIKNYLSLFQAKHEPDEHLSVIEQNINILLKNMLNFLDVEKLQKGNTIYMHDTLVDLADSTRKKTALFRVLAEQKNINIKLKAENKTLIRIDPLALDRILNNLLDNAVKYIQEDGQIIIEVQRNNHRAILRISDNGPGLPEETFDHIFEPYYLLSRKKASKQGIGVGLSIVKKIIDGLGAGITVEKRSGGGVSFTISFIDNSNAENRETVHVIPDTSPSPRVSAVLKEKNISAQKPALLVVDDNVQLLQFIQTSLEKKYNVFPARDVSEALLKLKTGILPSLIIADIMMDGEDGFTLLEKVSAIEKYNKIPFIFLTAMSGEKQRTRGLDLGAVDYIEKPFSIFELGAKIDSLIALRKRQKKQDLQHIKNRVNKVLSEIQTNHTIPRKPQFKATCEKYGLSERETEISKLLLAGLFYKEIAAELHISLRTVEYNINKIYKSAVQRISMNSSRNFQADEKQSSSTRKNDRSRALAPAGLLHHVS